MEPHADSEFFEAGSGAEAEEAHLHGRGDVRPAVLR
jgi:hypothetical protein